MIQTVWKACVQAIRRLQSIIDAEIDTLVCYYSQMAAS